MLSFLPQLKRISSVGGKWVSVSSADTLILCGLVLVAAQSRTTIEAAGLFIVQFITRF